MKKTESFVKCGRYSIYNTRLFLTQLKLRLVIVWVLYIIAYMKEDRVDEAVKYACSFIHTPYVYGGNGTGSVGNDKRGHGGFDCSGFVIEVLQAFNALGHGDWTAQGLYDNLFVHSKADTIPCKGTLLFFGKSVRSITHVALSMSVWQMIEAGGGDSRSTSLENSTGFVRLRPLNWRNDLVAVLMPPW